jgi:hypothetical protein
MPSEHVRDSSDRRPKPYLSACAIYQDEADYLAEWIEFHRLIGVERFFLYDNGSRDHHRKVLAPYVEDGIVTVREWLRFPGQMSAYADCLEHHLADTRWLAFIDLDEFLFSPISRSVADVLVKYEQWPAVAVNCLGFGTSNHREKPDGLVIESYVRRARNVQLLSHVKSIVDPQRTRRPLTPHHFEYDSGVAVDADGRPVTGPFNEALSFDKLRINHYTTKSEAEYRVKAQRPRADNGQLRPTRADLGQMHRGALNRVPDETILPYVEPLRRALERTPKAGRR